VSASEQTLNGAPPWSSESSTASVALCSTPIGHSTERVAIERSLRRCRRPQDRRRVAYLSRRTKKSVRRGSLGRRHDPGRVALEPGRVGSEMTTRNVEVKMAWLQNPDTAEGCRSDAISRYRDPQGHC
jgi:hypothetical protein